MSLECVYVDRVKTDGQVEINVKLLNGAERLFTVVLFNSFVVDYLIRQRVTAHASFFFVYNLPIPRLNSSDPRFLPIVTRATKLICTTPDFDDLAKAVGMSGHTDGVTDLAERAKLRAELDGMVAHLYGLTQADFEHILATFPLVAPEKKDAALQAFKDFAPKQGDTEIAQLIAAGESAKLEFKSTARWNVKANMADKKMEHVILKTVAAFWNAEGGTLLIGVEDSGNIYGLDADYKTLGNKGNRDGFELFLTDLLLKDQPELRDYLQVSFHSVEDKDVCRVVAKAASKPVYVDVAGVEK
jgi:Putative DNA-binding domain